MKFLANVCSFPGLNLKENSSNGRGDKGKIYIGLQVKGPQSDGSQSILHHL